MFGGGASNPYDDIVAKTTDENLTAENWELILNLCDKVTDEKDEGAHNVIAALLKRLAHRNPNVQLYALSLADALSKNCGILVNKELASRAFTQGLEKIVMDRTTHDKVRKRTLALVAQWSGEFENDTSLGVMEDCYNNLKAKGYKFDTQQEPLPPTVDDEIRRKEEEELQRVLEMSMQDRGGRDQWAQYSLSATSGAGGSSSSAVGGSSSSSSKPSGSSGATAAAAGSSSAGGGYAGAPKYQGGYVPARTPSPQPQPRQEPHPRQEPPPQQQRQQQPQPHIQTQTQDYAQAHSAAYAQAHSNLSASSVSSPSAAATTTTTTTTNPIVTRVRALHTFEPTEPGELAFEKGDIIKVVDRGYKDWWRGQLKGRTGIFPVNYVEPMPEPTANELAREAEQEAAVFSQAVNVEKLLNMLRAFDPAKDNLADNEEIQELYRSSMALRPKIVKLIDKYSQKRADLVSMNETFVRARTIFDRMMEESLARHTGLYDTPQGPYRPAYGASSGPGRPDTQQARVQPSGRDYVTSPGGGAPGYPGYPIGIPQAFPEPQPTPTPAAAAPMGYPAATPTPGVYGYPAGPQQPQPQPQPHSQIQPLQPQPSVNVHQHQQQQPQIHQQQPQQPQPQAQPSYSQLANAPYSSQGPTPYPAGSAGGAPAPQPQQQQIQSLQPQQQHQQSQPQPQPQQPVVGQQQQQQQQPAQGQYGQNPYQAGSQPGYDYDAAASGQAQYQAFGGQAQAQPQAQQPQQPQQPQQTPQVQAQPQPQQQVQQQQVQPVQQPAPQPQPAQQQVQPTQHPVQQQQPQPQPTEQQQQPAAAQASAQHQPSTQSGPPYIFDPNATYADANVQAWAHYYAQGGRDLAGSVYFVSIPGLTDGSGGSSSPSGPDTTTPTGGTGVQAQQPQAQGTPAGVGGGGYQPPQQDRSPLDQGTYATQQPQPQQASNPYFDGAALGAPQQLQQPQQQLNNGSSTSLGSNPHSAGGGAGTLGAGSPGTGPTGGYGTSPTTTATTPSWVLPKKGAAGQGGGGGDVQGLSGRFGGVSLTDPGMIG